MSTPTMIWSPDNRLLSVYPTPGTRDEELESNPWYGETRHRISYLLVSLERKGEHPYFLVRLALAFTRASLHGVALQTFLRAREIVMEKGIEDENFSDWVQAYSRVVPYLAEAQYQCSLQLNYDHPWKRTERNPFPIYLYQPPQDHARFQQFWEYVNKNHLPQYLLYNVIESNGLAEAFFVTKSSLSRLVRSGRVTQEVIEAHESSRMKEPKTIKHILDDHWSAYTFLAEILKDINKLDRRTISNLHAKLMKNSNWSSSGEYTAPGLTRNQTGQTVLISNHSSVQCCPYHLVDEELDLILSHAKQCYSEGWENPFASASWIHYALTNCHPFHDGNGRLSRMIASIPLLKAGYPPISIPGRLRNTYHQALEKAGTGDYAPLAECFYSGMASMSASFVSLMSGKSD